MKIIFAKEIGFCFGVRRALKMVEDNLLRIEKPIQMYGSLVHNEEVTRRLAKMGIKINNDYKKIKKGTLIISAHGISPEIKASLQKRSGLNLLDTTCPIVNRVQKIARLLTKENKQVLIFGDLGHQEVLGIKGATKGKAIVFSSKQEFLKIEIDKNKKYALVAQTTQDLEKFKEIEKIAKKRFIDIEIFHTVCQVSCRRQAEIKKLAKRVDLVLIIGSQTSANTKRLYQISSRINSRTYFVNQARDLKKEWFKNKKSVATGTGSSAPDWVISKVAKKISLWKF